MNILQWRIAIVFVFAIVAGLVQSAAAQAPQGKPLTIRGKIAAVEKARSK